MDKIKYLLFVACCSVCLKNAQAQEAKPLVELGNSKYPRLEKVKGKIERLQVLAKEHDVLRLKDKIYVPKGGRVEVLLSPTLKLILDESTTIEIPSIRSEDGGAEYLFLSEGTVGIDCNSQCGITIETPLSKQTPPPGELAIRYDPARPRVQWWVQSGEWEVRGLEIETFVLLKANEQTFFEGKFEDGQVVYDTLLRNKKVAQGTLAASAKMDESQIKWLKDLFHPPVDPVDEKRRLIKKKAQEARWICKSPRGEHNQCWFQCEGLNKLSSKERKRLGPTQDCPVEKPEVSCQRYRCNANGVWADPLPISAIKNRCKVRAEVRACDGM